MKVRAKVSLDHVIEGEVYEVIEQTTDQEIVVDDKCGNRHVMFDDGEYEVIEEEQPKKWNGEGLPPVGSRCEFRKNPDEWLQCVVFGHRNNGNGAVEIFVDFEFQSNWDYSSDLPRFRPIKSEKEKEIEKFDDAIDEWTDNEDTLESLAEYLYKKGFRFKGE